MNATNIYTICIQVFLPHHISIIKCPCKHTCPLRHIYYYYIITTVITLFLVLSLYVCSCKQVGLVVDTQPQSTVWPGGEGNQPFWSEGGPGCLSPREEEEPERERDKSGSFESKRPRGERVETYITIHVWSYTIIASLQNAHNHPTAEGECSLQENIGKLNANASMLNIKLAS